MKSNKKSLFSKTYDFLKFVKPCLIAMLCIFLVGALIFGIWGFNKGFDFTGGTQLVVDFPYDDQIQTTEGLNDASAKIKNILNENGIRVNTMQVQGEDYNMSIVVTFKDKSESKLETVRLKINKEFNTSLHYSQLVDADEEYKILSDEEYKYYDITKDTSSIEGLISPTTVLMTIATLLFALVVVMIYALFRFKFAGALTIVFGAIADVVLTACLIAIARVEINTYFFGALGVVLIVSLLSSVGLMYDTKQKAKDPLLSDKTNHELINAVVNDNLLKNTIIFAGAAIVALVFGVLGMLNVLHLALVLIVGLAFAFATHLFVLPAFWATINKKRELSRPVYQTNNNDSSAEEIVVEEEQNDDDKEKEEVEVVEENNKEDDK